MSRQWCSVSLVARPRELFYLPKLPSRHDRLSSLPAVFLELGTVQYTSMAKVNFPYEAVLALT